MERQLRDVVPHRPPRDLKDGRFGRVQWRPALADEVLDGRLAAGGRGECGPRALRPGSVLVDVNAAPLHAVQRSLGLDNVAGELAEGLEQVEDVPDEVGKVTAPAKGKVYLVVYVVCHVLGAVVVGVQEYSYALGLGEPVRVAELERRVVRDVVVAALQCCLDVRNIGHPERVLQVNVSAFRNVFCHV